MTDSPRQLAAVSDYRARIAQLEKALRDINNTIYVAGAPLGSENYFTVRHLCVDALHRRRAPVPVQTEDLAGAVWDGPNTASQVDPCMALVSKR